MRQALFIWICLFFALSSTCFAQGIYIGDQYITLPAVTNVSCTDCISASEVDWATLNRDLQSKGVNWSDVDARELQRAAVNWSSLNQDVRTTGINWTASVNVDGNWQANNFVSDDGSTGASGTITVKGSDGANCDLVFKNGLFISETCP